MPSLPQPSFSLMRSPIQAVSEPTVVQPSFLPLRSATRLDRQNRSRPSPPCCAARRTFRPPPLRRALGGERHAGPRADADIDAAGRPAPAAAWRRRSRPMPRRRGRAWRRCPSCMPMSSGVKVQANGTTLATRSFSAARAGANFAASGSMAPQVSPTSGVCGTIASSLPPRLRHWRRDIGQIIAEIRASRHEALLFNRPSLCRLLR